MRIFFNVICRTTFWMCVTLEKNTLRTRQPILKGVSLLCTSDLYQFDRLYSPPSRPAESITRG